MEVVRDDRNPKVEWNIGLKRFAFQNSRNSSVMVNCSCLCILGYFFVIGCSICEDQKISVCL